MKVIYTKHALEKIEELKKEKWFVTKTKIRQVIKNPTWRVLTRENQNIVMSLMDEKHILRIVLGNTGGIIKVITFHIGRRERYESTL